MKKHSYTLTILTIVIMLIVIISATYAFFATNMSLVNNVSLNIVVPDASRATYTSYSTDSLQLNVGLSNMLVNSVIAAVTDTGDLIVKYSSPAANDEYECTYDIQYVWDSTDQYTTPSMTLTTANPYELSISATASASGDSFSSYDYTSNNLAERDLSTFSWNGTAGVAGRYATIIQDAKIYANTVAGTTVTWTFNMNFYSMPSDQTAFLGKTLSGHVVTGNIRC